MPAENFSGERLRAVIAGDDLFMSGKIASAAKQHGFEVSVAGSREALSAQLAKGPLALLLVDLSSDRLNSIALVEEVRQAEGTAKLPIVGFAGHVEKKLMEDALAAGCDAAVANGVLLAKFGTVVAGVLRR